MIVKYNNRKIKLNRITLEPHTELDGAFKMSNDEWDRRTNRTVQRLGEQWGAYSIWGLGVDYVVIKKRQV